MHKSLKTLFKALVFVISGATLSPAFADEGIVAILPQLKFADTRLEMAQNPPAQYKAAVEKALAQLSERWRKGNLDCANPKQAKAGMIQTKIYLQALLQKIAAASGISARMNTAYGVCIEPVPKAEGIFAGLFDGVPGLGQGVIELPVDFLRQMESENELAFVVAHELSHFLLKHEILLVTLQGEKHDTSYFENEREREADELGMRLAINAGYDITDGVAAVKKLRGVDPKHFSGNQMDDLYDIVMNDLAKAGRTPSLGQADLPLPREVVEELNSKPAVTATSR